MLRLAFQDDSRTSIALASHAYYVDMVDALMSGRTAGTSLHFVVGFDTFVRVLDREDKYTARYHRAFSDRTSALSYLLARANLIIAGRAGAGYQDIRALAEAEPEFIRKRILYLDFPEELAARSATDVRNRARRGRSISGLVPPPVERYIHERELYK
jgi:nicotinic acid mononucleotide adenylyltransferase